MGRPADDKRTPATIDHHRKVIAELYLKQWRQVDIAAKLGINQATVSRDLKAIRKVWQADASQSFDELKSRELARIDELEREYWKQYRRSKKDFTRNQSENVVRKQGEQFVNTGAMKVKQVKESRLGDPRYLAGIQWCIEQRCKILGIEAPKKTDVTSGGQVLTGLIINLDAD